MRVGAEWAGSWPPSARSPAVPASPASATGLTLFLFSLQILFSFPGSFQSFLSRLFGLFNWCLFLRIPHDVGSLFFCILNVHLATSFGGRSTSVAFLGISTNPRCAPLWCVVKLDGSILFFFCLPRNSEPPSTMVLQRRPLCSPEPLHLQSTNSC